MVVIYDDSYEMILLYWVQAGLVESRDMDISRIRMVSLIDIIGRLSNKVDPDNFG